VSAFAITAGGVLTAVAGSPFATGAMPSSVTVGPIEIASTGTVYVANQNAATVSVYTLDTTSGVLTVEPSSLVSTGPGPRAVAMDPSNQYLYVANGGASSISAFAQVNNGNVFSPISGSPFIAGGTPDAVVVDPYDRFLY